MGALAAAVALVGAGVLVGHGTRAEPAEMGAGGFFFEPADRPHVIEVLEGVRMDVVRLIPEGREATTGLD